MLIPVACKLCGGNVELECWEYTELQREQWMGYIQCMKCQTSVPMNRPYSPTKEQAKIDVITAWNKLHSIN